MSKIREGTIFAAVLGVGMSVGGCLQAGQNEPVVLPSDIDLSRSAPAPENLACAPSLEEIEKMEAFARRFVRDHMVTNVDAEGRVRYDFMPKGSTGTDYLNDHWQAVDDMNFKEAYVHLSQSAEGAMADFYQDIAPMVNAGASYQDVRDLVRGEADQTSGLERAFIHFNQVDELVKAVEQEYGPGTFEHVAGLNVEFTQDYCDTGLGDLEHKPDWDIEF